MNDSPTLSIRPASLRRFITDALVSTGLSPENAALSADVLATADEFGVSTHGVKLLPGYLKRLQGGGRKYTASPA